MNKNNDKIKRMRNIAAGAIAGYLVGLFTPVAVVGAGISMVCGIVLFGTFILLCKTLADEYEEERGE